MRKPAHDSVTDIKRRGGAEELINPSNVSEETDPNKYDNKDKFIPIDEVVDPDNLNPEDGIFTSIDASAEEEKNKFAKRLLNFIEKNEHKFEQYKKDKELLSKKLEDNKNINNSRQRVNTEALQEELDRIENNFKKINKPVGLTEKLFKKLINMPPDQLMQYKNKLAQRVDFFKENKVEDSQAA